MYEGEKLTKYWGGSELSQNTVIICRLSKGHILRIDLGIKLKLLEYT